MTTSIVVGLVLAIFATFAAAMAYVQVKTHGMVAPGALPID